MAEERYSEYSMRHMFGHIASELSRALSWKNRNQEYYTRALERALDIADALKKRCIGKSSLKEVARLREVLSDLYAEARIYNVSIESLLSFTSSFVA